ncbi:hypothetical protein U1Q18_049714 [Sarracenia purpurea var. burkii]
MADRSYAPTRRGGHCKLVTSLGEYNAELNETSFAAQAATTRLIRANAAADSWHEDFNTLSRFVLSNNPELFRDAFRVPSQRDSSTQPDIVQGAPSSLGANSATPDAMVPLTSQQQMRLTVRRDTQPPPGIQPFSREDERVLSTDPREPDLKRARSSEYKRKPSSALIPPPRLETIREEDSRDIEPPYNRTSMADRLRTVQLSMQQEQAQSSAHQNVVQMETEDISTSGMVTSGATSAATASGPSYMGATADQRSQDPAVRLPPGLYPTQHLPIVRTTSDAGAGMHRQMLTYQHQAAVDQTVRHQSMNIGMQQWYPLRQPPAGALPAPVAVRFPTPVTSQAYVSQFTTPPVATTQASTTRGKYTTIRPPAQPMASVTGALHIPPYVVLSIGTNDIAAGMSSVEFADNFALLRHELQRRNVRNLIVTPPWRIPERDELRDEYIQVLGRNLTDQNFYYSYLSEFEQRYQGIPRPEHVTTSDRGREWRLSASHERTFGRDLLTMLTNRSPDAEEHDAEGRDAQER